MLKYRVHWSGPGFRPVQRWMLPLAIFSARAERVIHSLLADTATTTLTEASQIRRRAVQFYSSLYSSEYEEQEAQVERFCNGLPQVSEETKAQLNRPLQTQELLAALQGMQGWRAVCGILLGLLGYLC